MSMVHWKHGRAAMSVVLWSVLMLEARRWMFICFIESELCSIPCVCIYIYIYICCCIVVCRVVSDITIFYKASVQNSVPFIGHLPRRASWHCVGWLVGWLVIWLVACWVLDFSGTLKIQGPSEHSWLSGFSRSCLHALLLFRC